jgi:cell division protein FtsL
MELKAHKYLREEKNNNMKQMIKYNLKHLWNEHKVFVIIISVALLVAIIV